MFYSERWRKSLGEEGYGDAVLMDLFKLFHYGGPYHIEKSPLICRVNQWNGLYMKETSAMKELNTWYSQP